MAKLNDLTGKTFGYWQVLFRNGSTRNNASIWHCRCSLCGNEYDVAGYSLTSGSTTKCRSCVPRQTLSKPHRKERIYRIYSGMMNRCYISSNPSYKNYGGRGITVCPEWYKRPDIFIEWAFSTGYNDSLSIDRIDTNRGYSPDNCRWIPMSEQAKNRRISVFVLCDGKTLCLSDACKKANVNYDTVRWYKHKNNCSYQEAFEHYASSLPCDL